MRLRGSSSTTRSGRGTACAPEGRADGGLQRGEVGLDAGPGDHRRADVGAGDRRRHADGDGVGELAGREQRALDLGRVDVHAAADDEVDGPAADGQVALVVQPAEVAGAQPAVGDGQRVVGAPVAGRDGRRAHPHLAGLAARHVGAVRRRRRRRSTYGAGRPTLPGRRSASTSGSSVTGAHVSDSA